MTNVNGNKDGIRINSRIMETTGEISDLKEVCGVESSSSTYELNISTIVLKQ